MKAWPVISRLKKCDFVTFFALEASIHLGKDECLQLSFIFELGARLFETASFIRQIDRSLRDEVMFRSELTRSHNVLWF